MLMGASVPALAQLLTTDCSDLYPGIMPTECAVDEDGLIVLPDGINAPYTVTRNPVVVQEGDRYTVPRVDRDSAGLVQYYNSGNCYYDSDDVTVLYEDGNIPISQNPCDGIVF